MSDDPNPKPNAPATRAAHLLDDDDDDDGDEVDDGPLHRGRRSRRRTVLVHNEISPRVLNVLAVVARLRGFHNKPMSFLNLVKFRKRALYPDGSHSNWSGARAYKEYMDLVKVILPKYNAKVIFSAVNKGLMIGRVSNLWDATGIVWYPDFTSAIRLLTSPEYLEKSVHRAAGLEGEINILTLETDDLSSTSAGMVAGDDALMLMEALPKLLEALPKL